MDKVFTLTVLLFSLRYSWLPKPCMDWHRPGGCERAGEGEKYFSQSLLATDTRVTSCSKGGHSLDEYLSDGWILP